MSLTAAQRRASEMSKLQYSRAEKVREQTALMQELRGVIGAAQADHVLTLRSLEAAVAVSKRSGMIEYRQSDAKAAGNMQELMKRIEVVEKDLSGIDKQIDQLARVSKASAAGQQSQCRNFAEWFAMNGRPKNTAMLSQSKTVYKRIENHGVSDSGQVGSSLAKTSTFGGVPQSRSLGTFAMDRTKKSQTGHVPLADKSGFRLEPLPKSNYKPLIRGNLFKRQ